jgi:hypothetical protein
VNRRRPREKPPGRDTERLSLRLPALAGSEAAELIGESEEGSGYGESFASQCLDLRNDDGIDRRRLN